MYFYQNFTGKTQPILIPGSDRLSGVKFHDMRCDAVMTSSSH